MIIRCFIPPEDPVFQRFTQSENAKDNIQMSYRKPLFQGRSMGRSETKEKRKNPRRIRYSVNADLRTLYRKEKTLRASLLIPTAFTVFPLTEPPPTTIL